MQIPKLEVSVRISPLPSEISIEELNQLFAGEVSAFESWFIDSQRNRGVLDPVGLISAEHAILRSFMYYLHTKETR
jgi:hypothetical protein